MLMVCVHPIADQGLLIALAIAELGFRVAPTAVVEAGDSPRCSLIRAVVEVVPNRAGRHERERRRPGAVVAGARKIAQRLDAGAVTKRKVAAADGVESDRLAIRLAVRGAGHGNGNCRTAESITNGLAAG